MDTTAIVFLFDADAPDLGSAALACRNASSQRCPEYGWRTPYPALTARAVLFERFRVK